MSTPDNSECTESISLSDQGFDEEPAHAVVTAVAEARGRSPLKMEPLSEVIDPDALSKLLSSLDDRSSSVTVSFDYCGQQVIVSSDTIQITDLGSAER